MIFPESILNRARFRRWFNSAMFPNLRDTLVSSAVTLLIWNSHQFKASRAPVTNSQLVRLLNALPMHGELDSYLLLNLHNPSLPIRWSTGDHLYAVRDGFEFHPAVEVG